MKFKVNIRRNGIFTDRVKLEAEALDGKILDFHYGWMIEDDETTIYKGETAWILDNWNGKTPLWIASGDLAEVNKLLK